MLVPAQLHREELKQLTTERWFEERYKWYFAGEYYELQIGDNFQYRRSFACLDSNGKIVGYFSHNYNEHDRRMRDFGLMSFVNGINRTLVNDVQNYVKDMFLNKGAISLELWAFSDNPVCKLYNHYVKEHGGKKLCELTNSAFFNGKFHNTSIYEIQAENFKHKIK
jgi:hypothetical protein